MSQQEQNTENQSTESQKKSGRLKIWDAMKSDFQLMRTDFMVMLKEVLDLHDGLDRFGTITSIRKSIYMRGINIWLLICAIVVASIGLDTNSPAIIIGGMLISPLMYPILGVGLAIGINDRKTLASSLRNFGVAIVVSLITSSLYFFVTPFGDVTNEILARTKPTILDVFVGFFGGIAGIVAGSRKDMSNAIPGVAIATALLPPICVSGFGLASGKWDVFVGSFYLFFLNSVFITIATYLVVRYLKFPQKEHTDESQTKKAKMAIGIFSLIIMLPSFFFLRNVLKEASENRHAQQYIETHFENNNHHVVKWSLDNGDSIKYLKIVCGGEYMPKSEVDSLESILQKKHLKNAVLKLTQLDIPPDELNAMEDELRSELMTTLELNNAMQMEKDGEIERLREALSDYRNDSSINRALHAELSVFYPDLKSITYGYNWIVEKDASYRVHQLVLSWSKNHSSSTLAKRNKSIESFVEKRFSKIDKVVIINN